MRATERHGPFTRGSLAAAFAVAIAGCGHTSRYVWIDDVSRAEIAEGASRDYVVASGDVLNVRVYNQDAISTRARVRPDGRVAMPLAGEIEALGRRPADLAREIEAKLKPFVLAPAVTIGVEEVSPLRVSVIGEVARPGVYALDPRSGVIDALAAAGGMTEYADRDRIFVVRKRPPRPPLRIRFSYSGLAGGSERAAAFSLAPGDVVTIE